MPASGYYDPLSMHQLRIDERLFNDIDEMSTPFLRGLDKKPSQRRDTSTHKRSSKHCGARDLRIAKSVDVGINIPGMD